MSEADDAVDVPSPEPDRAPPARSGGDAAPAVDVESLEILVSAPVREETIEDLPAVTVAPTETAGMKAHEVHGGAEHLLDAVRDLGEQLGRRLDALQIFLEREQRAEAARERVVDRLHAELQEYKQDLLLKVQRPIFIDLIQLHDDIGKLIDAQPADQADSQRGSAARSVLESIQTGVEDILYRQGVEPFVREGNEFDPRKQRAVSTVATDDPALGKTVAARLRKGFHAGDKIIRPEIVTVHALRQTRGLGSQEG